MKIFLFLIGICLGNVVGLAQEIEGVEAEVVPEVEEAAAEEEAMGAEVVEDPEEPAANGEVGEEADEAEAGGGEQAEEDGEGVGRPDAPRLAGVISQVSLYRGTALVSRLVELPEEMEGTLEIVVTQLPSATDPATVFSDRSEGVQIRSVACREREPDDAEVLEGQVAELDRLIGEVGRRISEHRNEIALRRIRQEFLRALQDFVAPAATFEMAHGVLQADELEKLTQMHFSEYETASQEIMELDNQLEDDSGELAMLQARRARLAEGPPTTYDAVVFLDKEAGAASFQLNYLVRDCGWLPVYNVRGDSGAGSVEVEFNALIHQVSGEDWQDARLILSTASPTVSAYNPRLSPLYVRMMGGRAGGELPGDDPLAEVPSQAAQVDNTMRYQDALSRKAAAVEGQNRGGTIDKAAMENFAANEAAASVQLIELSERLSELRRLTEATGDEEMSIQYELEKPVSLISRREGQMVPVWVHQGEAEFYHVAAPVLTASVFREAELENDTGRDMLGGLVSVYLDGDFTGRTDMPSIARGRKFTLGFGVDGQLRARRVVVDRIETIQGGNRRIMIESEIILDNYREEPVTVQVRERLPYHEDEASLRVQMGEMGQPLSLDSDYQKFEKPKGILRWDVEVGSGAGEEATSLRYAYTLEFDRSLQLQEIGSEDRTRARDEFLQDSRRSMLR